MTFINDITDFIFVEDEPEAADIIFIPGSGYGEMALTAAALWHRGLAPYILPSGKYSKLTGHFSSPDCNDFEFETEYDYFRSLLLEAKIPEDAILKENEATYTYENAIYSRRVTDNAGITVNKAILCCQAYHARRCLLYYKILYPDTRFIVCPTVTRNVTRDNWFKEASKIDLVLGEVEKCGSQFHQILRQYGID